MSTAELMNRGMECLLRELGIIDAEQFISVIIRERDDYTKWQRKYFDKMDPKEIEAAALAFDKQNPYKGDPKSIVS